MKREVPWLLGMFLFVTAVTILLTSLVLRYARDTDLLDHPNQRSSHVSPTPRGGGLAIVLVLLSSAAMLTVTGILSVRMCTAFVGGGAAVGAVGWCDDRRGVRAGLRAIVHLGAAGWAVWWLGGVQSMRFGTGVVHLGLAGSLLSGLAIAWSINAFNFMDGIDGIAGAEGAFVGVSGGALLMYTGHAGLGALALAVGAACVGFVVWNWSPASIFMGDVGSGFLGFFIGTLAVASETTHALPLDTWFILYGAFAFDATLTLVRRALRGEKVFAAHRSHAYQRLARAGWGHQRVVLGMAALNVGLAALAFAGERYPGFRPAPLAAAVLLLGGAYLLVERWAPMTASVPDR